MPWRRGRAPRGGAWHRHPSAVSTPRRSPSQRRPTPEPRPCRRRRPPSGPPANSRRGIRRWHELTGFSSFCLLLARLYIFFVTPWCALEEPGWHGRAESATEPFRLERPDILRPVARPRRRLCQLRPNQNRRHPWRPAQFLLPCLGMQRVCSVGSVFLSHLH
jgi:hypothetical protein